MAKKARAKKPRESKAPKAPATSGAPTPPVDRDEAQPALIAMSEAEVRDEGRKLATNVRELEDMTADHALKRTEMANQRDALREEIGNIAQTIRQQGR